MLDTDEVLAVWGIGGDLSDDIVAANGTPGVSGEVTSGVAHSFLENLKPVTRSIIGLDVIARGSRHVYQART